MVEYLTPGLGCLIYWEFLRPLGYLLPKQDGAKHKILIDQTKVILYLFFIEGQDDHRAGSLSQV